MEGYVNSVTVPVAQCRHLGFESNVSECILLESTNWFSCALLSFTHPSVSVSIRHQILDLHQNDTFAEDFPWIYIITLRHLFSEEWRWRLNLYVKSAFTHTCLSISFFSIELTRQTLSPSVFGSSTTSRCSVLNWSVLLNISKILANNKANEFNLLYPK